MAVPKKKTSKRKRRSRFATWNRKADLQAQKALSLGKAVLSQRNTGFYYPPNEVEEEEDD
ncbi:50S ribosomal protein L32 [Synechococcus sp. PCC 7336]|uniref:50S ribosomal protein L32 n=1 Tax=Synechococcus sp. PCC 7336 TaxID=195250 RepID=UPI0003491FF1|nr:50S ribosomal protein L32 [Synechococcus sp. PCC 7336]